MLASGKSVSTMSFVTVLRRTSASSTHPNVRSTEKPYRISLPTSVTSPLVAIGGRDANSVHTLDLRMLGNVRNIKLLGAPYDRPCPSAASTSTSGPHIDRAVETMVWKPRVRLLAPSATTRPTSAGIPSHQSVCDRGLKASSLVNTNLALPGGFQPDDNRHSIVETAIWRDHWIVDCQTSTA